MIPPRRSIPVDYELPPEDAGSKAPRDWPEFVDDDEGRASLLGSAIVVILAVIAVALIWMIFLGWRVAA
jgi:hypothetical protein